MKKIFDEIHGYIMLNDLETKIVDSPIFQRLRRIKQTSLAYLVYPGATHTRFSHSLGTFYLATKIGERYKENGEMTDEELMYLKLASLLHDIGQFPFSHAIELLYLPKGLSNSVLRNLIIQSDMDLQDLFDKYGIDKNKITSIFTDETFLSSVIDSDVDVDRMDYLIRDSRHTGVQLGNLDLERLIDTITYSENRTVQVMEKGIHSLENFYISRLHMYQAVYYHKTILGYELYLREIFRKVAEICCSEILNPSYLKEIIKNGSITYWDDEWVISKLYEALASNDIPDLLKLQIKNFFDRNGPKVVFEETSFSPTATSLNEIIIKLEKYGIPGDSIFPFEENIRIIDKSRIKIITKSGKIRSLREFSSSLLTVLPDTIYIKRVYVDSAYVKRAREIVS
ncbi:MAG: HD domain-containing protein [Sulfolobus sp.]